MDLKNMEQLNNSFIVIQNDKTIKFLDQQYLFVEKPTECGVFTLKQLVSLNAKIISPKDLFHRNKIEYKYLAICSICLADITDLIYTFWGVAYECY